MNIEGVAGLQYQQATAGGLPSPGAAALRFISPRLTHLFYLKLHLLSGHESLHVQGRF